MSGVLEHISETPHGKPGAMGHTQSSWSPEIHL